MRESSDAPAADKAVPVALRFTEDNTHKQGRSDLKNQQEERSLENALGQ